MKYLCVDDDIRDKQLYCELYNLDIDKVIYAATLKDALDTIENRFGEFDAAILDINIEIGDEECMKHLKGIVTEDRLKSGSSTDGGFYIYLKLLDKGFPNNRIAFLSAYINEGDIGGYTDRINTILQLMSSSGMLNESNAAQCFSDIEQQVYLGLGYLRTVEVLKHPVNKVIKLLKGGCYTEAYEGLQSISKPSSASEEIASDANGSNEKSNNIDKNFKAFQEAGISIPPNRKFSKNTNKYHATSDKTEAKGLITWLNTLDENSYYALRSGIIEGCLAHLNQLYSAKDSIVQMEESFNADLFNEYRSTCNSNIATAKYKMKNMIFDYENRISYAKESVLAFHKRVDAKHNTKVEKKYMVEPGLDISFEVYSNEKKEIYDIEYFEDMLLWLKEALPLREPEATVKKQLYRQIIRQLSHPYEAAYVMQPRANDYNNRTGLMQCSITAVLKCVRNWTAHSRISEFDEKDMAFLFVLFMRSYFIKSIANIAIWEKNLIKLAASSSESLEELEVKISKEEFEGIDKLITKSLNSVISGNGRKLPSLNIYELLTDIGKRTNCCSDYLYKMFWHTMYFPSFKLDNIILPEVSYNHKENTLLENGSRDILTLLYLASFKKAFGQD
jgi:hypothetical protein